MTEAACVCMYTCDNSYLIGQLKVTPKHVYSTEGHTKTCISRNIQILNKNSSLTLNPLLITDRFSLIQNNEWKSPLKILSLEMVNCYGKTKFCNQIKNETDCSITL